MVRAELLGAHSHVASRKVRVHVWLRDGKYLARGRYMGQVFGETLGNDVNEASARLRRLLGEIEDKSYVRPTEARQRPLSRGQVPHLTLRQLIDEFLMEKRRLRGECTAATYRSRLMPVLDFAERLPARQRWPLASSVDHAFAVELRNYLFEQYKTTRNGHLGGVAKSPSARQIRNVLECFRSMMAWAQRPEIRKLPADWANPVTEDVVGKAARKNPLREDKLPLEARVRLAASMDHWQLCQLALSLTLPLRPEEASGLLISDINWDKHWLEFRTRLGGADFTKGRQDFVVPFPAELGPILRACAGGRAEGPLLRSRAAFEKPWQVSVTSTADLVMAYDKLLARAPSGTVLTEQDRKQVFRTLLRDLGGVSPDQLAREFRSVLCNHGLGQEVSLYTLRHAVTTAMHRTPGMPHLELSYLTGHTTRSILAEYVPFDPGRAMQLYFATIQPLLDVVTKQAHALGLTAS
jgi:integrase